MYLFYEREKKQPKDYATLKIKGLKGHNGIKQRKQDSKKLWKQFSNKSSKCVRELLSKCTTQNFEVLQYNVQTTLYHPHSHSTKKNQPMPKDFFKNLMKSLLNSESTLVCLGQL